jgi:hypothetical protein
MEQNATEPVHQKDLAMTFDLYTMFLIVGVPAIGIAALVYCLCVKSGQCSREEEEAVDQAALEGDLTHYIRSLNKGEVA